MRHTLTDGSQQMTFESVPRGSRKVLCDDGGENLIKITTSGTVIGAELYPGEVTYQSVTVARKTWETWKERRMVAA